MKTGENSLNGVITDPSGRVLPLTGVTAVEIATARRRTTTTAAVGTYDIPRLPVGNYTISFEREGFKTLTFVDLEEVTSRTRTLDVTLQVSGQNERLEASTVSALMNRNNSAVTGLIEREQADELPLNGCNRTFEGVERTNGVNQTERPWVGLAIPPSPRSAKFPSKGTHLFCERRPL